VREFGIQGKTIKSQKGRIEVLTSKLDTLSSSLTTARQRRWSLIARFMANSRGKNNLSDIFDETQDESMRWRQRTAPPSDAFHDRIDATWREDATSSPSLLADDATGSSRVKVPLQVLGERWVGVYLESMAGVRAHGAGGPAAPGGAQGEGDRAAGEDGAHRAPGEEASSAFSCPEC